MNLGLIPSLKLFYCYAHEDKAIRDELDIHLSNLKRQDLIVSWSDYDISPGLEREKEIKAQINSADIILLLISPHFIASHYCYSIEMQLALERHKANATRVIPIIVRPVDWEGTPFSTLKVLPVNALPITLWDNRDAACDEVAKEIRKIVLELLKPHKEAREITTDCKIPNAEIASGSLQKLSFQEKSELVDKLLACSSIRNNGSRETILKQLSKHLSDTVERHPSSRSDVFNIVDKCLEHPGGLRELIDVLSFFEGDSLAMQQLRMFVRAIIV